ncbi:metallophosphoesterase [Kribbella sp. NBC_01245]|uniref:metallophosphoesterase family protein n=1 Tax=Kribbella sp. NBC_01245 TaxID=2903578 RepID=UPI002E29260A|nr:metallophosphoesterase [Kribbella sp. NBC_01245]
MSELKLPSRRSILIGVTVGAVLAGAATSVATASKEEQPQQDKPIAVSSTEGVPVPGQRLQLSEKGARAGTFAAAAKSAAGVQRLCAQQDARWLRVRFAKLDLAGSDRVTVVGAAGGKTVLTATNWRGEAFYTKAFPGRCVTVTPSFANQSSQYVVDAYQDGAMPLPEATVVVAAAGDICGSACNQTRPVVTNINPAAVITAGDNAYDSGTLSEYNNKYHPQWGAFKSKTYPSAGNHEYQTSGASGYFDYFNGVGQATGRAGARGKGYYSVDIGDWHFIALNSNISKSTGSTQEQWLRADLAANTKPCVAAYWHHPRFSAGNYSDNTSIRPFFQALYDYKADLIINGHDHNYIRFAPSRPDGTKDTVNGVRQLLIGTGGKSLYGSGGSTVATIEKKEYSTFGVGKLTLTATGYTADFVPVAGRTFTDTVTGTCHNA